MIGTVLDLNQCLRYSHNPKCYNIVIECGYRVMSVFRMAARDLGSVLKSNLAPTEIDTVSDATVTAHCLTSRMDGPDLL